MFDISFTELMIIAIVALVVIGPERLPRAARAAGLLFGRMQRYVSDVKADISREIQLDELKRLQADIQASARDLERSVVDGVDSVERSIWQTAVEREVGMGNEVRPIADDPAALLNAGGPPAVSATESLAMESSPVSPLTETQTLSRTRDLGVEARMDKVDEAGKP